MSDVFISYARPDEAAASQVAEALRGLGYGVWMDDQLAPHRAYADEIAQRLTAAKAVVALWSPDAVKSQWVRAEADVARLAGTLVQVSLDGAVPPLPFNQVHCAHLGAGWSPGPATPGWRRLTASIAELMASAATAAHQPGSSDEKRHLTVLSCHLLRARGLDPEDWHAIAARHRQFVREAAARFGGFVARAPSESQTVYFGYPVAQEDAAERAVWAALAIVGDDQALAHHEQARFSVRVAIHAGAAFVSGAGADTEVSGDVADVAARAQAAAAPEAVVVTEPVRELVANRFTLEPCGSTPAEGEAAPLGLYRVLSPSGANPRRRGFSRPDPTPFVGRGEELDRLLGRWRRVREGEGQMVSIIGEPGIGKTRLIEEFRVHIGNEPHLWIECGGAPLFATTPFYAVGQMLEQALEWRLEPMPEGRLQRLEDLVRRARIRDVHTTTSVLAELVNLPLPEGYPALAAPADQKRARVFAALARWVFSSTTREPLVLVIEDLHWVDPSTLELVETLAEQGAGAPLLLIASSRPEFRLPWASRAHHAHVVLGRLSNAETRNLVGAMAAEAALASETAQLIIERADGVPLFAEELTRLMRDRGRAGAREIPATLQDSLVARLDRLGGAKQAAQLGAVLGREFSYELICAVSTMPEGELRASLAALSSAELIQARGLAPDATYRFKHALIQDAAYDALLKSQRRKLHERVAQAITQQFPALAEAQPEVLARHWAAVGDARRTMDAWAAGAKAATARHAYKEAAEDYRLALEMLAGTPDTPERDGRELELLGLFIGALQIVHGYSAVEVEAASRRARDLASKGGLRGGLGRLFDEWAAKSSSGDYRSATELAEQLLSLARAHAAPRSLAAAHMALLSTRNHAGDLIGAEAAFEAGKPYFSETAEGRAPGAIAQTFGNAAINAWIMGDAEEARRRIGPVRKLIGGGGNPYDLAFSEYMTSMLALMLGDLEEARALSAQSIRRSAEEGFPQFTATSSIVSGCAGARLGDSEAGLSLMLSGIAAMGATGNRSGMTVYLTWLAQALALSGDLAAALQAADDALTINPEERYFRPESLRLRGEVNLRLGNERAALADLRAAVELAKSMRAEQFLRSAAASLERASLQAPRGKVPPAMTPRRS